MWSALITGFVCWRLQGNCPPPASPSSSQPSHHFTTSGACRKEWLAANEAGVLWVKRAAGVWDGRQLRPPPPPTVVSDCFKMSLVRLSLPESLYNQTSFLLLGGWMEMICTGERKQILQLFSRHAQTHTNTLARSLSLSHTYTHFDLLLLSSTQRDGYFPSLPLCPVQSCLHQKADTSNSVPKIQYPKIPQSIFISEKIK